jgi:hypothetical protein
MLTDYCYKDGCCFAVDWEGWMMFAKFCNKGQVLNSHDEDFIYNGKKLINPLDSPVRVLQLEGDVCYLEHVGAVYNQFSVDEHGLKNEVIFRTDR